MARASAGQPLNIQDPPDLLSLLESDDELLPLLPDEDQQERRVTGRGLTTFKKVGEALSIVYKKTKLNDCVDRLRGWVLTPQPGPIQKKRRKCPRGLSHAILLLFLVILMSGLIIHFQWNAQDRETKVYWGSELNLTINLHGCDLHISGVSDDTLLAHKLVSSSGDKSTTLQIEEQLVLSYDVLKVNGGNVRHLDQSDGDVEWSFRAPTEFLTDGVLNHGLKPALWCSVSIIVGSQFNLSALHINTHGECLVSATNVNLDALVTVSGTGGTVTFTNVSAPSYDISIDFGFIDLYRIQATDRATGISASVRQGDIAIAPVGVDTVNLDWNQPCGYVCLPCGSFANDTQCTDNDIGGQTTVCDDLTNCELCDKLSSTCFRCDNATVLSDGKCVRECPNGTPISTSSGGRVCEIERACASRNCSAQESGIRLLPIGASVSQMFDTFDMGCSTSAGSNDALNVNATANIGTIYLYDDRLASDSRSQAADDSFTGDDVDVRHVPPQLSDALLQQLSSAFTSITSFQDIMIRLSLLSYLPSTLWAVTTSRVFLQVEPGLLETMSATIITPKRIVRNGTLMPGFCPRAPPTLQESDSLLIRRSFVVQSLIEKAIVNFEDRPNALVGHRRNSGLFSYVQTEKDVAIQHDVSGNISMTIAIWLSVVLSILVGIASIVLTEQLISFGLGRHHEDSQLAKRLEVFRKREKERHSAALTEKHLNKGNKKDTVNYELFDPAPIHLTHFELIDAAAEVYATFRFSSLDDYCHELVNSDQFKTDTCYFEPLAEFHASYQAWCTEHERLEIDFSDDTRALARNGLAIVPQQSARSEVFTRIKWKSGVSILGHTQLLKSSHLPPREEWTSLDDFIHHNCIVTSFDYDHIFCSEFEARYAQFCKDGGYGALPVRDRDMAAKGCNRERKMLNFVQPAKTDECNSGHSLAEYISTKIVDFFFTYRWLRSGRAKTIANTVTRVCSHLLVTLLIPVPLLGVTFLHQQQSAFLAYDGGNTFTVADVLVGPTANSLQSWPHLSISWPSDIIFYGTIVFYAVSGIVVMLHYTNIFDQKYYQKKKDETDWQWLHRLDVDDEPEIEVTIAPKHPAEKWYQRFVGAMVRNLVFACPWMVRLLLWFFVGGFFAYVNLVLSWALLSAIINPFQFLPYATGAATLITTITVKIKTLRQAKVRLQELLLRRIEELVANAIASITGRVGHTVDSAFKVARINTSPKDVDLMKDLISGDRNAIERFSEEFHIDSSVVAAIVAGICDDTPTLRRELKIVSSRVGVDGDLTVALLNFAMTPGGEFARRTAVKPVLFELSRVLLKNKQGGRETKEVANTINRGNRLPDTEQERQTSVQKDLEAVLSALIDAAYEESFDPVLTLLEKAVPAVGSTVMPVLDFAGAALASDDSKVMISGVKLLATLVTITHPPSCTIDIQNFDKFGAQDESWTIEEALLEFVSRVAHCVTQYMIAIEGQEIPKGWILNAVVTELCSEPQVLQHILRPLVSVITNANDEVVTAVAALALLLSKNEGGCNPRASETIRRAARSRKLRRQVFQKSGPTTANGETGTSFTPSFLQTRVVSPLAATLGETQSVLGTSFENELAAIIAMCRGATMKWASMTEPLFLGLPGQSVVSDFLHGVVDVRGSAMRQLYFALGIDSQIAQSLLQCVQGNIMSMVHSDVVTICRWVGFQCIEPKANPDLLESMAAVISIGVSTRKRDLVRAMQVIRRALGHRAVGTLDNLDDETLERAAQYIADMRSGLPSIDESLVQEITAREKTFWPQVKEIVQKSVLENGVGGKQDLYRRAISTVLERWTTSNDARDGNEYAQEGGEDENAMEGKMAVDITVQYLCEQGAKSGHIPLHIGAYFVTGRTNPEADFLEENYKTCFEVTDSLLGLLDVRRPNGQQLRGVFSEMPENGRQRRIIQTFWRLSDSEALVSSEDRKATFLALLQRIVKPNIKGKEVKIHEISDAFYDMMHLLGQHPMEHMMSEAALCDLNMSKGRFANHPNMPRDDTLSNLIRIAHPACDDATRIVCGGQLLATLGAIDSHIQGWSTEARRCKTEVRYLLRSLSEFAKDVHTDPNLEFFSKALAMQSTTHVHPQHRRNTMQRSVARVKCYMKENIVRETAATLPIVDLCLDMAVSLGALDLEWLDEAIIQFQQIAKRELDAAITRKTFRSAETGDALRIAVAFANWQTAAAVQPSRMFARQGQADASAAAALSRITRLPLSIVEVVTSVACGRLPAEDTTIGKHIPSVLEFEAMTEVPRDYVAVLVALRATDKRALGVALRRFAPKIWPAMSLNVASAWIALGNGDVRGVEFLAREILQCDPDIGDGLVALACGTPESVQGSIPKLATRLGLNSDTLTALVSIANRDSEGVERYFCFNGLWGVDAEGSKSLKAIVRLFSRNADEVKMGIKHLSTVTQIKTTDLGDAVALAQLFNGINSFPSHFLDKSIFDTDFAALLITLLRVQVDQLSWKSLSISSLPELFLRFAAYLGWERQLKGKSHLSHVGHVMCSYFYDGLCGRNLADKESLGNLASVVKNYGALAETVPNRAEQLQQSIHTESHVYDGPAFNFHDIQRLPESIGEVDNRKVIAKHLHQLGRLIKSGLNDALYQKMCDVYDSFCGKESGETDEERNRCEENESDQIQETTEDTKQEQNKNEKNQYDGYWAVTYAINATVNAKVAFPGLYDVVLPFLHNCDGLAYWTSAKSEPATSHGLSTRAPLAPAIKRLGLTMSDHIAISFLALAAGNRLALSAPNSLDNFMHEFKIKPSDYVLVRDLMLATMGMPEGLLRHRSRLSLNSDDIETLCAGAAIESASAFTPMVFLASDVPLKRLAARMNAPAESRHLMCAAAGNAASVRALGQIFARRKEKAVQAAKKLWKPNPTVIVDSVESSRQLSQACDALCDIALRDLEHFCNPKTEIDNWEIGDWSASVLGEFVNILYTRYAQCIRNERGNSVSSEVPVPFQGMEESSSKMLIRDFLLLALSDVGSLQNTGNKIQYSRSLGDNIRKRSAFKTIAKSLGLSDTDCVGQRTLIGIARLANFGVQWKDMDVLSRIRVQTSVEMGGLPSQAGPPRLGDQSYGNLSLWPMGACWSSLLPRLTDDAVGVINAVVEAANKNTGCGRLNDAFVIFEADVECPGVPWKCTKCETWHVALTLGQTVTPIRCHENFCVHAPRKLSQNLENPTLRDFAKLICQRGSVEFSGPTFVAFITAVCQLVSDRQRNNSQAQENPVERIVQSVLKLLSQASSLGGNSAVLGVSEFVHASERGESELPEAPKDASGLLSIMLESFRGIGSAALLQVLNVVQEYANDPDFFDLLGNMVQLAGRKGSKELHHITAMRHQFKLARKSFEAIFEDKTTSIFDFLELGESIAGSHAPKRLVELIKARRFLVDHLTLLKEVDDPNQLNILEFFMKVLSQFGHCAPPNLLQIVELGKSIASMQKKIIGSSIMLSSHESMDPFFITEFIVHVGAIPSREMEPLVTLGKKLKEGKVLLDKLIMRETRQTISRTDWTGMLEIFRFLVEIGSSTPRKHLRVLNTWQEQLQHMHTTKEKVGAAAARIESILGALDNSSDTQALLTGVVTALSHLATTGLELDANRSVSDVSDEEWSHAVNSPEVTSALTSEQSKKEVLLVHGLWKTIKDVNRMFSEYNHNDALPNLPMTDRDVVKFIRSDVFESVAIIMRDMHRIQDDLRRSIVNCAAILQDTTILGNAFSGISALVTNLDSGRIKLDSHGNFISEGELKRIFNSANMPAPAVDSVVKFWSAVKHAHQFILNLPTIHGKFNLVNLCDSNIVDIARSDTFRELANFFTAVCAGVNLESLGGVVGVCSHARVIPTVLHVLRELAKRAEKGLLGQTDSNGNYDNNTLTEQWASAVHEVLHGDALELQAGLISFVDLWLAFKNAVKVLNIENMFLCDFRILQLAKGYAFQGVALLTDLSFTITMKDHATKAWAALQAFVSIHHDSDHVHLCDLMDLVVAIVGPSGTNLIEVIDIGRKVAAKLDGGRMNVGQLLELFLEAVKLYNHSTANSSIALGGVGEISTFLPKLQNLDTVQRLTDIIIFLMNMATPLPRISIATREQLGKMLHPFPKLEEFNAKIAGFVGRLHGLDGSEITLALLRTLETLSNRGHLIQSRVEREQWAKATTSATLQMSDALVLRDDLNRLFDAWMLLRESPQLHAIESHFLGTSFTIEALVLRAIRSKEYRKSAQSLGGFLSMYMTTTNLSAEFSILCKTVNNIEMLFSPRVVPILLGALRDLASGEVRGTLSSPEGHNLSFRDYWTAERWKKAVSVQTSRAALNQREAATIGLGAEALLNLWTVLKRVVVSFDGLPGFNFQETLAPLSDSALVQLIRSDDFRRITSLVDSTQIFEARTLFSNVATCLEAQKPGCSWATIAPQIARLVLPLMNYESHDEEMAAQILADQVVATLLRVNDLFSKAQSLDLAQLFEYVLDTFDSQSAQSSVTLQSDLVRRAVGAGRKLLKVKLLFETFFTQSQIETISHSEFETFLNAVQGHEPEQDSENVGSFDPRDQPSSEKRFSEIQIETLTRAKDVVERSRLNGGRILIPLVLRVLRELRDHEKDTDSVITAVTARASKQQQDDVKHLFDLVSLMQNFTLQARQQGRRVPSMDFSQFISSEVYQCTEKILLGTVSLLEAKEHLDFEMKDVQTTISNASTIFRQESSMGLFQKALEELSREDEGRLGDANEFGDFPVLKTVWSDAVGRSPIRTGALAIFDLWEALKIVVRAIEQASARKFPMGRVPFTDVELMRFIRDYALQIFSPVDYLTELPARVAVLRDKMKCALGKCQIFSHDARAVSTLIKALRIVDWENLRLSISEHGNIKGAVLQRAWREAVACTQSAAGGDATRSPHSDTLVRKAMEGIFDLWTQIKDINEIVFGMNKINIPNTDLHLDIARIDISDARLFRFVNSRGFCGVSQLLDVYSRLMSKNDSPGSVLKSMSADDTVHFVRVLCSVAQAADSAYTILNKNSVRQSNRSVDESIRKLHEFVQQFASFTVQLQGPLLAVVDLMDVIHTATASRGQNFDIFQVLEIVLNFGIGQHSRSDVREVLSVLERMVALKSKAEVGLVHATATLSQKLHDEWVDGSDLTEALHNGTALSTFAHILRVLSDNLDIERVNDREHFQAQLHNAVETVLAFEAPRADSRGNLFVAQQRAEAAQRALVDSALDLWDNLKSVDSDDIDESTQDTIVNPFEVASNKGENKMEADLDRQLLQAVSGKEFRGFALLLEVSTIVKLRFHKHLQEGETESVLARAKTDSHSLVRLAALFAIYLDVDHHIVKGLVGIVKGDTPPDVLHSLASAVFQGKDKQAAVDVMEVIIGLAQRDIETLLTFAKKRLGAPEVKAAMVFFDEFVKLRTLLNRKPGAAIKNSLIAKLADSSTTTNYSDLFLLADEDHAGSIDFDEYYDLIRALNYPNSISREAAMKAFVTVDKDGSGLLNLAEFDLAMKLAHARRIERALSKLQVSDVFLIITVGWIVAVLIVFFVFIFAGIEAFASPNGFTATVNSIWPMASGVVAYFSRRSKAEHSEPDSDRLGEVVAEVTKVEVVKE